MAPQSFSTAISRRQALAVGALSLCTHLASHATPIYTPHEMAAQFERRVAKRLRAPQGCEERLYACIAELQLNAEHQSLVEPQYLLLVDRNPNVQSALLAWRLAPGVWKWLGAVPVSTGAVNRAGQLATPQGLFAQSQAHGNLGAARVYDFGWQPVFHAGDTERLRPIRLQALAADWNGERLLGSACTDGCILLPASMIAFLDDFGLLDGAQPQQPRMQVPYRGQYLLVIDSERDDRPDWSLQRA